MFNTTGLREPPTASPFDRLLVWVFALVVLRSGPYVPFLVSDTRLVWEPVRHLRAGIALRLWRNDSGLRGIHQTVPEAILQWRF
jgi:hypothetical protein